jgi:hypothetical protein
MANYPSPCEKCKRADTCRIYMTCNSWRTRYLYRQKQINAFAQKVLPDYSERQRKWREEHEL